MFVSFPSELVTIAEEAGMKVPTNANRGWPEILYPHFTIFCIIQLGASLDRADDIARVIAGYPEHMVKLVSAKTINLGVLIYT
jgi:hypothetical protein